MSTHNIGFYEDLTKIIFELSSNIINYTPTAIMLARYVTHMNTQSPGGICYASLDVGWYARYQPTSTKA